MFHPILQIRFLHLNIKAKRGIGGTGSAIVVGFGRRNKKHLPSLGPETLAPIHVFCIHEEFLIERSYLVQCFSADQPETTVEDIYGPHGILWPMIKFIPGKRFVFRKQTIESQRSAKHVPDSRESTAGALQFAVTANNTGTSHTHIGVCLAKIDQTANAAGQYFHV